MPVAIVERTKALHRLPHGPTILLAAAVVITSPPLGLTRQPGEDVKPTTYWHELATAHAS